MGQKACTENPFDCKQCISRNQVNSDSLVAVNDADNHEFDDELLDEWHEFLQDDELYEMIVDSMSLSHLESSALKEENANDDVMLPVVLATVENMALDH